MQFRFSRAAADLLGGEAALLLFLLTLLPLGEVWLRLCIALGLSLAAWGYFRMLVHFGRWSIEDGTLCTHLGLLFPHDHRVPLSRITSLLQIRSAASRPLGVCTLFVFTAGTALLLPCIRHADARALELLWRDRD